MAVDKQNVYVFDTNSTHTSNLRDDLYCYNMLSRKWKELPTPLRHCYFVLLVIDGLLTAIGGLNSITLNTTRKVSTFSKEKNSWISVYPCLLMPRLKPGAVVHCDHVIVAGGHTTGGISDNIEILNWKDLPLVWQRSPIHLLFSICLATREDDLFIVGYSDNTATIRMYIAIKYLHY